MKFLHEAKSQFSSVTQTLPWLSLSLHIMEITFLLLPTSTFWPIFQNNPVYLLSTTPPPPELADIYGQIFYKSLFSKLENSIFLCILEIFS